QQVLLDIHGINRDSRIWEEPEKFKPERFKNWQENPYTFIPQGGGMHDLGHRCAGEWITIETLKVATDYLVNKINYQLPEQDLSYSLTRLPTLPASGVVMKEVKVR
ncbi:MAG: cytochrome P450, partial [Bacteroidota bacterium]